MILQVPYDARTYELTNSVIWFDEDGILYSQPKASPVKDPTHEEIMQEMERFRSIVGSKKIFMIAEANSGGAKAPNKEQRTLMAKEIASVTKALAVIVTSPLVKMIIRLFYAFSPPDYPVKMFTTEKEAKEWIRQYL